VRALLYFGVWIVIDQSARPSHLLVGALASVAAAWVSVTLLPPAGGSVRLGALVRLLPRFLWQSLVAGVDVARRAFDPRLPLNPGLVVYRPQLPPGSARSLFTAYTSLLPGTVPCGDGDGGVVYHCLDISQPIVEQLAAEEARLSRAIRVAPSHDE
jgi:multicomponent Na+:H+ antiporter subunit E